MPKLVAAEEIICDPVWPSAAVMAWYTDALVKQLKVMSRELLPGLHEDWKLGRNAVGFAADRLATDAPSIITLLQRRLDTWARRWERKWERMSDRIADDFARKSRQATDTGVRASFRKAGFTVKFKVSPAMTQAYGLVVEANVGLIRSIPQQYLKDIRTHVWDNVRKGSDMNQLTLDILKTYGIATRRAAFIARDQTNKAKASMEEARRAECGIEEADWQHSSAGKEPRPTHVEAGRKKTRYKTAEGWLDPAINKRIWPGTEINCRCTSRAVIPGLTRKKR